MKNMEELGTECFPDSFMPLPVHPRRVFMQLPVTGWLVSLVPTRPPRPKRTAGPWPKGEMLYKYLGLITLQ